MLLDSFRNKSYFIYIYILLYCVVLVMMYILERRLYKNLKYRFKFRKLITSYFSQTLCPVVDKKRLVFLQIILT